MGIASIVLGALSVLNAWASFVGVPVSLIFGIVGIILGTKAKQIAGKEKQGKIGFILSVIGTVIAIIGCIACVACGAALFSGSSY